MRRVSHIAFLIVLIYGSLASVLQLVMHLDDLRRPSAPPVAVRINEERFIVSNRSSANIGRVVIHYGNAQDPEAHKVLVWCLRAGETRIVKADGLKECSIDSVFCNGELYMQKEDS